jgi:hypothetical protein
MIIHAETGATELQHLIPIRSKQLASLVDAGLICKAEATLILSYGLEAWAIASDIPGEIRDRERGRETFNSSHELNGCIHNLF